MVYPQLFQTNYQFSYHPLTVLIQNNAVEGKAIQVRFSKFLSHFTHVSETFSTFKSSTFNEHTDVVFFLERLKSSSDSLPFVLFPADTPCFEQLVTKIYTEKMQLKCDGQEHCPQDYDGKTLEGQPHFFRIQVGHKVIKQIVHCINDWSKSEDYAAYQILLHEEHSIPADCEKSKYCRNEADEPYEFPGHSSRQSQFLQRTGWTYAKHDEETDRKTQ